eukprot:TRINITY_DN22787_c0_g1_i2.p1 TRINITY_DN22787_c0_g1~~TRINITY_DN22787_c0_g1_i2.p1  ORF type:complete len:390 (+),score=43.55 TRINITY_DN22787_c0_g1_i2:73-1170(+)
MTAALGAAVRAAVEDSVSVHKAMQSLVGRRLEVSSHGGALGNSTAFVPTLLTTARPTNAPPALPLVLPLAAVPWISTSPAPDPGCQLLSTSFGWWLQAILGFLCFVSLFGKRFTDRVRRPWKIWFFDTSKQGLSALVVHFLNIVLSMAFGEFLSVDADPCNWYWINLTLDDTLGLAIQFILLRSLQCVYRSKFVNRPELALSGEYGDPPDSKIYVRQLLDWQGLIVVQKSFLAVLVVRFTVGVTDVAEVLLGWLDPHPRAKLVIVMVVTPLTMNVFALWVADNFLKSENSLPDDVQAREMLVVGSSTCVVGQRGGRMGKSGSRTRDTKALTQTTLLVDDLSGDEADRAMSFDEWKQRSGSASSIP